MKYNYIFLAFFITLMSCKSEAPKDSPQKKLIEQSSYPPEADNRKAKTDPPFWSKNAVIYKVDGKQFSKEGNFRSLAGQYPRLQKLGVDILWLSPVFPTSNLKRTGAVNNPYAINDLMEIDPKIGTKQGMSAVVRKAHTSGMKVILELAIGQTGWDHKWIKSHPEYYLKDNSGKITSPTINGIKRNDVAALDLSNSTLRQNLLNAMEKWVKLYDVDGFVHYNADAIPDDFWKAIAEKLMAIKPLLYIADSNRKELRNYKYFHIDRSDSYTQLCDDLVAGKKTAADVKAWYESNAAAYQQGTSLFSNTSLDAYENIEPAPSKLKEAYKVITILSHTLGGMPIIHAGDEEPNQTAVKPFSNHKLKFESFGNSKFLNQLNGLKYETTVLHNFEWGVAPNFLQADDQLLVYELTRRHEEIIVILNLSDQAASYPLHKELKDRVNVLAGKMFSMNEGQNIELSPWGHLVLTKRL